MKIYESAKSRAAALKSIKPVRIAVALVGEDWRRYVVDPGLLEAVIVSPKPGSNPFAIEELGDAIGWDKLYLLEDLHSKLYIGKEAAFLGSPNLSANGFGDNGNYELGVLLTNEKSIKKLNIIFEYYRKQANADYPTKQKKTVTSRPLSSRLAESHREQTDILRYRSAIRCPEPERL
ncbi:phospholipase D-like domain-containing protein [uncultured Thiodictyon sp.]|uniref:phospholipase D-like domain-containing protein n=1 Tax=uncultured Thiodictyon sp. TaxID=1846217 RepID=UPI0025D395A5|nr:phospholipase D-like domain-containing protein [uncultured Thiodictyon sp.]